MEGGEENKQFNHQSKCNSEKELQRFWSIMSEENKFH